MSSLNLKDEVPTTLLFMSDSLDNVFKEVHSILENQLESCVKRIQHQEIVPYISSALHIKQHYDRALMVRLGCEVVGGEWRLVIPAMISAELTDFSVYVVDDILDDSPRRLNELALHQKYGMKLTIPLIPILKSLAVEILIDNCVKNNLPVERILKAVLLLENAHRQIYEGQFLDVKFEEMDVDDVTEEMYLDMIEYTTGFQMSAYAQVGALLVGCTEQNLKALKDYGFYTGTIFQIRDDFIDYINSEEDIGKPPFQDFMHKKKRLPILLALKFSNRKERELLIKLLGKSALTDEDKSDIIEIVTKEEVIDYSRKLIGQLKEKAIVGLNNLNPPAGIRAVLNEILELASDL